MPLPDFDRPVTVLVGLGFPCRIETVSGALSFLDEYPTPLRDEAYFAALDTCRDARAGRLDAATAQDVFTAFARRRGIYVDDSLPEELAAAAAEEKLAA